MSNLPAQNGLNAPSPGADLWVFGYGSLMWRPEFAYDERRRARVLGYSRRFRMNSFYYRGTTERPGLVLALDQGPEDVSCAGVAYRVHAGRAAEARSYLYEREKVAISGYVETFLPVVLEPEGAEGPSEEVQALCYVLNHNHRGYSGRLSLEEQADRIACAHGEYGSNAEYLFNTMEHLKELNVEEPELEKLDVMVRKRLGISVL